MRMANFVEGLLFTIGFLALCLVVLVHRSAQSAPVGQLVPAPVKRHAPLVRRQTR